MKIFNIPIIMLVSSVIVTAGFKIPRHVYRSDQLNEAIAEASKEQKGLAFVLTDEGST